MTKIEIEEEYPLKVKAYADGYGDPVVILDGEGLLTPIWFSPDEARELIKALKKHIKKAEGK